MKQMQENLSDKSIDARIVILRGALHKIIEMNRQQAIDQYGNADIAEQWGCVVVARRALAECKNIKKS